MRRFRAAPPVAGGASRRERRRCSRSDDLHVWFDLGRGRELHAVQRRQLRARRGERLGLVGESGCGKTTTMLALMGLLPPTRASPGSVLLDGEDILAARRGSDAPAPLDATSRWSSRAR